MSERDKELEKAGAYDERAPKDIEIDIYRFTLTAIQRLADTLGERKNPWLEQAGLYAEDGLKRGEAVAREQQLGSSRW